MPTRSYSMKNVVATVDGQRVIGWYSGNAALTVTPDSNRGFLLVGAAGETLFSISPNKACRFKLQLMHTSPTHQLLLERAKQQDQGRLTSGIPFDWAETASGEGGTGDECFVEIHAEAQVGTEAQMREWTLVTGDYVTKVPDNRG